MKKVKAICSLEDKRTKTGTSSASNKPKVLCPKCNKAVIIKGSLTCTICKTKYHKLCAALDYPIPPKDWKCEHCQDADVYQLSPLSNNSRKSSHLINTPGASLMVIEEDVPNHEDIDHPIEVAGNKSLSPQTSKINIPTSNSFASLSTIEDGPEHSSLSSTDDTNIGILSEKIKQLKQNLNALNKKLILVEERMEKVQSENTYLKKKFEHELNQTNEHRSLKSPQRSKDVIRIEPALPVSENSVNTLSSNENAVTIEHTTAENGTKIIIAKDDIRYKSGKRILIFGDEQVKGLASKLIDYRKNKNLDKYNVLSFVKPNAKSSEILKNVNEVCSSCTNKDIIIVALGCNDLYQSDFMKCVGDALVVVMYFLLKCPRMNT